MVFPMLVDLHFKNQGWVVFASCGFLTCFAGGMLVFTMSSAEKVVISIRRGFMLTSVCWLTLSLFASFPLWFSELDLSFTDALFEAISGITTTGSTVIVGLDSAPPGLLMWRSILQWLGGIGIIVTALSMFPFLKLGGMQLFKTESSENEKAVPRAAELALYITVIYLFLTFICTFAYRISGLSMFDAIAHAMTTIATGGFSTRDASFGAFEGTYADMVATIFILISALPFVLYLKLLKGDRISLFTDSQVRVFLSIVFVAVGLLTLYKVSYMGLDLLHSLRQAVFHVTVIITGTGYGLSDFQEWGSFPTILMFCLMFIGGCAGSTTCSVKVFRYQILYETLKVQLKRLIHPHGVFTIKFNNSPVSDSVLLSVTGFIFLYFLTFALIAVLLFVTGLDPVTALSGAATSISNVGPGLGNTIGPSGTFKDLPDISKWILSLGMMLGRLELFTLYVVITPLFWRNR